MPALNMLRQRYSRDPEAKRAEDRAHQERYVKPHQGTCLSCKRVGDVKWWASMTQYEYTKAMRDAGEPDPNADLELCEECGMAHIQEMTDRWNEYHAGLGV